MSIGKRLKHARLVAGLSQEELSKRSGVTQQMISKLETDKSANTRDLVALAQACGVRPEWLATGSEPMEPPAETREDLAPCGRPPVPGELYREISIVGTTQTGPDPAWFELGNPHPFGEAYLDSPTQDRLAYALRVVGHGMEPRMREGDVLAVSPAAAPVPGDDVVVKLMNGSVLVKELVASREGTLTLRSIGEGEKRIVIDRGEVAFVHVVTGIHPSSTVKLR
jgi:phage repressor protein C with HTH and peptisase S24 domain